MASSDLRQQEIHASAALGLGTLNVPLQYPESSEAVLYLDVTAVTGTLPTLNVTVNAKDPVSGGLFLLDTFPEKTAANFERRVIAVIPDRLIEVSMVVGGTATPTVTFTLVMVTKDLS